MATTYMTPVSQDPTQGGSTCKTCMLLARQFCVLGSSIPPPESRHQTVQDLSSASLDPKTDLKILILECQKGMTSSAITSCCTPSHAPVASGKQAAHAPAVNGKTILLHILIDSSTAVALCCNLSGPGLLSFCYRLVMCAFQPANQRRAHGLQDHCCADNAHSPGAQA